MVNRDLIGKGILIAVFLTGILWVGNTCGYAKPEVTHPHIVTGTVISYGEKYILIEVKKEDNKLYKERFLINKSTKIDGAIFKNITVTVTYILSPRRKAQKKIARSISVIPEIPNQPIF
jgi:hypothetical protein